MAIEFSLAVPTLVSNDLETTKSFYTKSLGFTVNYEDGSGKFFSVQRGNAFVHFALSELSPRSNKTGWSESRPADVSFFVHDVRALHQEYFDLGVEILSPPMEHPYGIIDMDVMDPNGYVLRFNQEVE